MSADLLADWAPDQTPFRYGFNNPISYTDPFGLFERRRDARRYRRKSDDKDIRKGKIRKDKDGSFSIRYGESGSISQNSVGTIEFSSTASYTGRTRATLKAYEPNFFGRTQQGSFLGRIAVNFADDFWLTIQSLNPLDTRTTHLTGNFVSGDEAMMGLVGTAATVIPAGRSVTSVKSLAPKGLTIFQRLNAAQFSKRFKGTVVARTHPRIRGQLNRLLNTGTNSINTKVQTGNVLMQGTKISGKASNGNE